MGSLLKPVTTHHGKKYWSRPPPPLHPPYTPPLHPHPSETSPAALYFITSGRRRQYPRIVAPLWLTLFAGIRDDTRACPACAIRPRPSHPIVGRRARRATGSRLTRMRAPEEETIMAVAFGAGRKRNKKRVRIYRSAPRKGNNPRVLWEDELQV